MRDRRKINLDWLPKFMFFCSVAATIYAYGVLSHQYRLFPYPELQSAVRNLRVALQETGNLTRLKPSHFLQPARYEGNGVTVNRFPADNRDLVLLSGFFGENNGLRLIRRDGSVAASWTASFSELFPETGHITRPPTTDWNVDTHGALALPDGSVVFNFEYAGLARLGRCGEVMWTLREMTHHSVELAADGGFWVPGRRRRPEGVESNFPPFETPFDEDTILHVSEQGEVLREISVPGLFYRSGLDALLTANGEVIYRNMPWDEELVHLNKVAELNSAIADAFPMFDAGDLMLSLRALNLLMVVDPETETIKWWQTGPWLRQHDPEFTDHGSVLVFNNNIYRTAFEGRHSSVSALDIPRVTNILEFDPASGETRVVYGGAAQPLLSVVRGKLEPVPGGGLLITEFEGGRVLQVESGGEIVWEYVNRYDDEQVAELTEARVYPNDYFNVSEWSCE